MATNKPTKPSVSLPESFGGIKTAYTEEQISNGYEDGTPQVVDGGNINYEKDGVFQKLKYVEAIADAINNIPAGKMLIVDSNNRFDYQDTSVKNSFGNIGDIQYTARTTVPNGGAWCDGTLYTKAQFPDVYQMLVDGSISSVSISDFESKVSTNGSCAFFGLDTLNERFKVPKLNNVYIKSGTAPVDFTAESLPNITGNLKNAVLDSSSADGAFSISTGESTGGGSRGGNKRNASFDASRSSSTYQDGSKVNPDHVVYRAYVVLYASAAEASEAQAAQFIQSVNDLSNSKANIDGSNLSALFPYNMGILWLYTPDNYGGGCLSIPYGDPSVKLKIQIASITANANNFTWTYPIAFSYFCMVVSNGGVALTNKTLSSITVTDNNFGVSTKFGILDLIVIGI